MKLRIRAADTWFSKYIRASRGWKCQRCYKQYQAGDCQCAHMHTRGHESTRFDPDNVACLCGGCHMYIDKHPLEKIEFFTKLLGPVRFDALRIRTNQFQKKDDKAVVMWCKSALKELEDSVQ